MSRRKPAAGRGGARPDEAAATFMSRLRDDHAGLSRVLREIDAQQSLLQTSPQTARPVLTEALRYLLVYQHSVHHPREDRLFARIRAREPGLHRNMERLVREHRIGQQKAESLAGELSRTPASQLRGRAGLRLARQLQSYVAHTREHMRREEAVFYTGSERVLRTSDWAALMEGAGQRDPALDLDRLAARYPRLAARLADPERTVTGRGETTGHGNGLGHFAERLLESVAALAHDTLDLLRSAGTLRARGRVCVGRTAGARLRRRAGRAPARARPRAGGSRR